MLVASGFGIFMLFSTLWGHPFGIFFVLALTFFPGLVFLYLSCVRAGLVALKASGPPNMKKLGTATIRMFRFNIMLNNLTMTLVGLGGSTLILVYLTPDVWAELKDGFEIKDLADVGEILKRVVKIPLAVLLMLTLALSVSNGIIGTSSAAVAASAADTGPNHHTLWGVTRQFFPLFVLSMLVLWLPALIVVYSVGGPLEPLSKLGEMSIVFFLCLPFYLIWAGCAICGGKALAYVQTFKDLEKEWIKEREDMIGEIVPQENLRSLRLERQEAGRIKEQQGAIVGNDNPDLFDDTGLDIQDIQDNIEQEPPEEAAFEQENVELAPNTPRHVDELPSEEAVISQTEEEFRLAVEAKIASKLAERNEPTPSSEKKTAKRRMSPSSLLKSAKSRVKSRKASDSSE